MIPTEPCENCGHPSVAWTNFWDSHGVLCEFIELDKGQIFTPHTPENLPGAAAERYGMVDDPLSPSGPHR